MGGIWAWHQVSSLADCFWQWTMRSLISERAEVWLASQSRAMQNHFQIKISPGFYSVLEKFLLMPNYGETAGPCLTCVLPVNINARNRPPALLRSLPTTRERPVLFSIPEKKAGCALFLGLLSNAGYLMVLFPSRSVARRNNTFPPKEFLKVCEEIPIL